MHTDDDIFENLNIGGTQKTPGGKNTSPAGSGERSSGSREAVSGSREPVSGTREAVSGSVKKASDDDFIFESLDVGGSSARSSADSRKSSSASQTVRKVPKELNTAASSIDQKTFRKEKEKKKKSRIRLFIIAAIMEIITLAAIFAYGYFLRSWNLIQRPEVKIEAIENNNISLEKKEMMQKGYWNIAVFGVDGRDSSVVSRGLNSDVIIIASINKENGDIKMVSVFRDTYLNVSDGNAYAKINSAYCSGGPEQALAALNKNLDLNIQNYITFNWKAVADGINILGGVDGISLSKAELYYINAYITETVKATGIGSYQLNHTGEQHLDGIQAVAYARLRYMDTDFARTERQRNVIKACFKKAKTADFAVLNNIMVTCFPQVATNINLNEIVAMAQNITKYNIAETAGFPWSRGDATIGKKGDCVIPTTLESNVRKLHEFLFNETDYEPSDAVKRYSAKISEDSKLYKEGEYIDSVSTDGGVIQQPKAAASGENSDDSAKITDEPEDDDLYEVETDEDGNYILGTDEDGEAIYPTDEDGNIIKETPAAKRPTELSGEDQLESSTSSEESTAGENGPGSENLDPTRVTTEDAGSNAPLEPADSGSSTTPGGTTQGKNTSSGKNTISEDGPTALNTGTETGGPGSTSGSSSPSPVTETTTAADTSSLGPAGATSVSSGTSEGPAGATNITTTSNGPGDTATNGPG